MKRIEPRGRYVRRTGGVDAYEAIVSDLVDPLDMDTQIRATSSLESSHAIHQTGSGEFPHNERTALSRNKTAMLKKGLEFPYLNYAREHGMQQSENPPAGIILCAAKSEALVRYATDNLPTKLLVREYLTVLPDEKLIAAEIDKTRRRLETRLRAAGGGPAK